MSLLNSAFITGAGGFIGRHLVRQLLAENVSIVALMMPDELVPEDWGDSVRTVVGDVRNLVNLEPDIGRVDVIYHLAAVVSDWGTQEEHVATTVRGTEQAIALALQWDAHFIVTTSVCAYASKLAHGDLTEDEPVGTPASPYEYCKQEQERLTRQAVGIKSLRATIVRPGNVYGVGSGPWVLGMVEMLEAGAPALLGSGDWDAGLCHVNNLVSILIAAARSDHVRGDIFNAADNYGVTWNTYLHRLAEVAGTAPPKSIPNLAAKWAAAPCEWYGRLTHSEKRPPITRQGYRLIGGPNRFVTDKARTLLGYQPKVTFEQAMAELATEYGYAKSPDSGPWVWVTGSASGLGCYLTTQLLQKGFRVLATDQNLDALEASAVEQGWSKEHVALENLDVSVRKQWQTIMAKYVEKGARFSHLMNVAGIIRPGYSFTNMARDIGLQVKVNLIGTVNGCDSLLPHFEESSSGHIINIASLAALGPIPGVVGYCVSKSAVRSFSNGLAMDLSIQNSPVKISCVCPDLIATPMMDKQVECGDHSRLVFSGNRPLTTEEVGAVILTKVWHEQPMEIAIPARKAVMGKLMGMSPKLALWGFRRLEDKGRATLHSLRTEAP
jgi:nucleoside-diphosphate-sugar epimerase